MNTYGVGQRDRFPSPKAANLPCYVGKVLVQLWVHPLYTLWLILLTLGEILLRITG